MGIPMPGHPVHSQEEGSVIDDCKRLSDLIDAHDAVFLLTDTRESRWLPSLLCANTNKVSHFNLLDYRHVIVLLHFPVSRLINIFYLKHKSYFFSAYQSACLMWIQFIYLQITITAALGFDSFLVMRHGAGPFSQAPKISTEAATSLGDHMHQLSVNDVTGKERLGCYFCSDVVAPTDVIFHSIMLYMNSCTQSFYKLYILCPFCSQLQTALWISSAQ